MCFWGLFEGRFFEEIGGMEEDFGDGFWGEEVRWWGFNKNYEIWRCIYDEGRGRRLKIAHILLFQPRYRL
jgi:hypothetical protein